MWIRLLRSGDAELSVALAAAEESAKQLSAAIDRFTPASDATARESAPPAIADLSTIVEASIMPIREVGAPVRVERVGFDGPLFVAGDAALAAESVRALVEFAARACPDGTTLVIRLVRRPRSAYVEARAALGEGDEADLFTAEFPLGT